MAPSEITTEPVLLKWFACVWVYVCVSMTTFSQTHLGISFGLAAATVGVVVVVGAIVSIFVNSVQKPEQELEGVVLRVPPKLRSVLCHRTLRRRETTTFIFRLFAKVIKHKPPPSEKEARQQLAHGTRSAHLFSLGRTWTHLRIAVGL